jgi:hypothetical protein
MPSAGEHSDSTPGFCGGARPWANNMIADIRRRGFLRAAAAATRLRPSRALDYPILLVHLIIGGGGANILARILGRAQQVTSSRAVPAASPIS